MTQKVVKWGILSTGWIASCFVKALKGVPQAEVVAVASRGLEKANEFGAKYQIPKRYGTYEELAKDADVDIIYIATPHNFHKDNAILCLNNNKSILVEKAFTLNAKEAKEVVELARSKNLFVMEAMWSRFFPGNQKVKELLKNKAIGDIHLISADMSFNASLVGKADELGRLYNPNLAGGALLDSQPVSFETNMHLASTGVDESFSLFAKYANGATGFMAASLKSVSDRGAYISGSHGYIRIPDLYGPTKIYVKIKDEPEQVLEFPWPADYPSSDPQNGLIYEAKAVTQYMLEGKKESDAISANETIAIMETLDAIRAKWGIKYPGEQ